MKTGGVQRSLLNLVNELEKRDYEIEFFIVIPEGDLMEDIPKEIKVNTPLKMNIYLFKIYHTKFADIVSFKSPIKSFIKILFSTFNFLGVRKILYSFLTIGIKSQSKYDLVISFDGIPDVTDDIVLKKFNNTQKIAWVHSDASKFGHSKMFIEKHYEKFDSIAIVSESCKNIFIDLFPKYKNKCNVVYNTFNIAEIRKKGENCNPYNAFDGVTFVTVGRLDNFSKRIDRILSVSKLLLEENYNNFRWYIVGDGPDYNTYKDFIESNCLQKNVFLVGSKKNPYPYMKYANYFVMASDFEGYPMTLRESLILGIPCITVNFNSASEAVLENITGIITKKSTLHLYDKIKYVLDNPSLNEHLQEKIKELDVSNQLPLDQFFKMVKNLKIQ